MRPCASALRRPGPGVRWRPARRAEAGLGSRRQRTSATSPSLHSHRGSRRRGERTAFPPGSVAAIDLHLRTQGAGDRLDEVIAELEEIRADAAWPPLAAPIGQVLASQALVHVLAAERYQTVVDELLALLEGGFGTPPAEISPTVRRAVSLLSDGSAAAEMPDLTRSAHATRVSPRARKRSRPCSQVRRIAPPPVDEGSERVEDCEQILARM